MKRIFTLVMLALTVYAVQAQTITYNLTGCTGDTNNPTEVDEDDNTMLELYFTASSGYDFNGTEISVTIGGTAITEDWDEDDWYYWDSTQGYLCISSYDGIEKDVVVTITCKKAAVGPELPETFSAATFEEFTLDNNSVYRPSTFQEGDNYWLSGAVAFKTNVQDWSMYGLGYGYGATQLVNFAPDATGLNTSDSYLPAASKAAQGNNYGSLYISGAYEKISLTKTTLTGLAVTNTNFNAGAFIKGDGMSKETIEGEEKTGLPFHQDDYFKVTITGLNGEIVTGTVDYYLADYRTEGDWKFAKNWQWVDLSSLGEVDGLQFSLESTKKNNWGMTTASYVCIDNIGGEASDCTLGAMTKVVPEVNLKDEAYDVSTEEIALKVTYTRENITSDWGTICLPFDVKSSDEVEYFTLSAASSDVLTFEPVDEVKAGTPVVFKKLTAATDVELSASNVTLKPASEYTTTTTPITGWEMKGAFASTNIQGSDKYFIGQNKFWYAEDQVTVKPFRAWFETSQQNARSMVFSIGEKDGTTSILSVDADGELREQMAYDLTGRQTTAKGIVIINGKKIVR